MMKTNVAPKNVADDAASLAALTLLVPTAPSADAPTSTCGDVPASTCRGDAPIADEGAPVAAEFVPQEEFLVFGSPPISEDEIEEVVAVLRSGWIGTGPRVHQFQENFKNYVGSEHAVALNSCTAALHLALLGAGVGPGDEVITTPMTFCATVNAIIHAGATPVLADCDPLTFNIDPREIEKRITPRTRALLPVHFAGRACDMEAIMALARKHNLKVIEDCAHAIETQVDGKHAGTWGDFGCFSFYVTKNVVTGEGGMVVARDAKAADRIKILGLHGMSKDAWSRFSDQGYKHYQVVEVGFKYNMTDIQAALGLRQLEKVERYWQRRAQIWARYQEAFADLPCQRPAPVAPNTRHAHHLYTLLVDTDALSASRDDVLNSLAARGIGTGVHYLALHTHRYYAETFGWKVGDYPHSERISERTLSLPISAKLSDADVERVVRNVREVLLACP
jgi:dTDP-4-amino-4,6-dideoxygalactose transaminase